MADLFTDLFTQASLAAFLQVIMIDLVLAGDNAVVIGLAAAGLPPEQRGRAILVGIIAATVLRIVFASVAIELLAIVGLLFAGGVLLLWVCWKMWRELRGPNAEDTEAALTQAAQADICRARPSPRPPGRSCWPTSRCRSTTCWRWRAPRASIRSRWCSGSACRSC